jgi:hypothetical protein
MKQPPGPRGYSAEGDDVKDSIFYVVEIELPAKDLPEFAAWYPTVHAPHLFQAGFNNCTSYLAVAGGMSVVDIYQADDWSMFEAPAFQRYRDIVFADPYRPKILGKIENTRTVYHHHALPSVVTRHPALPLDADWVSIWRFAGDAGIENKVADWLAGGGAAALEALGARNLRLLHRGRDAPTGASKRPGLALFAEWDKRPPPEAQTVAPLPAWLASQVGPDQVFTGFRLYPWAASTALHAEATAIVAAAGR